MDIAAGSAVQRVSDVEYADEESVRTPGGDVPMPRTNTKRNPARTATTAKRPQRARSSGLRCPDCDFVAKHPMGLGRHRSTRHGVVSQRQARRDSEGGWLTRQEAARRAGVHYNTIRHWEQSGKLRTSRRPGHRGALVNASDLARVGGGSDPMGGGGADAARLQMLEQRFNELLLGLERLVAGARTSPRRAGGRGQRRT